MNELEELVELSVSKIDPIPVAGGHLISILQSENWEMRKIVEAIRFDPGLTAQLLALANSAFHTGQAPVSEVHQAVMRVGPSRVLSLVLASVVRGQLAAGLPHCGLEEGRLWRHSVAAALAIQECVPFCRVKPAPECFVAALLHDVGLLVTEQLMSAESGALEAEPGLRGRRFGRVARTARLRRMEQSGLGHSELGAKLILKWGLPELIADAVANHHNRAPDILEPVHMMAEFLKLADHVASSIGETCELEHRLSRGTLLRLGISTQGLEALCEVTQEKLASTLAIFEG